MVGCVNSRERAARTLPDGLIENPDVVVIGSGLGSLVTAALLARLRGDRVQVLERHFKSGGFTHAFTREGFTWDVGLHYVGEVATGSMGRRILDHVTRGEVEWAPLPDVYDVFSYPDLTVRSPAGRERLRATLVEQFPHERAGIDRYLRDVREAESWIVTDLTARVMPRPVGRLVTRRNNRRLPLATTTLENYLRTHIGDPRLRAVLASQWNDYGLPPAEAAFATHALVTSSYFDGALVPVGGSDEIRDAALRTVRDAGGGVLVNAEVTRIRVEDGVAVGVDVRKRRGTRHDRLSIDAPLVVSGIGAYGTSHLLPEGVGVRLARPEPAYSSVVLFVGLSRSPAHLGARGENRWVYDSYDHSDIAGRTASLLEGRARGGFMSFGALNDPDARRPTMQIITPVTSAAFEAWRDLPWRERGADYEAMKCTVTKALLDLAERELPGIGELVTYTELATPATIETFHGHPGGALYGRPGDPSRYAHGHAGVGPASGIPRLLLTGADVLSCGILGATFGGVMTASAAMGTTGFPRVMAAIHRDGSGTRREA